VSWKTLFKIIQSHKLLIFVLIHKQLVKLREGDNKSWKHFRAFTLLFMYRVGQLYFALFSYYCKKNKNIEIIPILYTLYSSHVTWNDNL